MLFPTVCSYSTVCVCICVCFCTCHIIVPKYGFYKQRRNFCEVRTFWFALTDLKAYLGGGGVLNLCRKGTQIVRAGRQCTKKDREAEVHCPATVFSLSSFYIVLGHFLSQKYTLHVSTVNLQSSEVTKGSGYTSTMQVDSRNMSGI